MALRSGALQPVPILARQVVRDPALGVDFIVSLAAPARDPAAAAAFPGSTPASGADAASEAGSSAGGSAGGSAASAFDPLALERREAELVVQGPGWADGYSLVLNKFPG